eukprot:7523426-Pyramimonas_sp.AAC.2
MKMRTVQIATCVLPTKIFGSSPGPPQYAKMHWAYAVYGQQTEAPQTSSCQPWSTRTGQPKLQNQTQLYEETRREKPKLHR